MADSDPAAASRLLRWLKAFRPGTLSINASERGRTVVGAALGILITALMSRLIGRELTASAWLVAPLGASAVLVFAVPASPLAQPWSVIGGNTLSALIGIACVRWIDDPALAASAAVGGAIGLMMATRSLHPPGGAMALLAVMTHATHPLYAIFPALVNSVLLVGAGIVYNSATGRRYPHVQVQERTTHDRTQGRFNSSDLDAVLSRYNQILDVSRDDLEDILQLTELHAMRRQLGEIRCADIMSTNVFAVQYATPLQEAWQLLREHRIKALPVVDRHKRILGIVTLADFMRHANIETHVSLGTKLHALLKQTTTLHTQKPEVVGQIMTSQVRVVSEDRHIAELVPIFSNDGHHHIPIIDADRRLVGIITESDFVRALYRSVDPEVDRFTRMADQAAPVS